jgi:hypothetical protein
MTSPYTFLSALEQRKLSKALSDANWFDSVFVFGVPYAIARSAANGQRILISTAEIIRSRLRGTDDNEE